MWLLKYKEFIDKIKIESEKLKVLAEKVNEEQKDVNTMYEEI